MNAYEPSQRQWDRDIADFRRRLFGAMGLVVVVTMVGTAGFLVIDPDAGIVRAFFMTAITLTTVGYGEEIAIDTDGARVFTAVLILMGMGVTLYFVSVGTAFLLEGQLGNVFRRRRMEHALAKLSGHLVVCGSGRAALYAAAELTAVERSVVLIAQDRDAADVAGAKLGSDLLVVIGDPTEDAVLEAAGIGRAAGLIACSEADNENVVISLTARQLNPTIRVVSKLQDIEQEKKVRKAGADAVVSPQHIGGLRMASELIRPAVVSFLDLMLRDRDRNLRISEVTVPPTSGVIGKRLRDVGLERVPGALLLAVRYGEDDWIYNPSRDSQIEAGHTLIFMGSPADGRTLGKLLGVPAA
jgi:voltage-gated potassium channel